MGARRKSKFADEGLRCVKFIECLRIIHDDKIIPFKLAPFQREMVKTLFGTRNAQGNRQFNRAFWAMARKSGKSILVAAIILYLMLGSGKKHQKLYSCSATRKQAEIVFEHCVQMIRSHKGFAKWEKQGVIKIWEGGEKRIKFNLHNNTFEALSSEGDTKQGLNPSVCIFDELHVFPNARLHSAMTKGSSNRREKLFIYITTAGQTKPSLCWELWEYARGVRDGTIKDDRFYPVIFEPSPDDSWTSEETWRKVMPGLGYFTNLDDIRQECELAKVSPAAECDFKQYYLNIWVSDLERVWLSVDAWNKCARPIDWTTYKGRLCYGGLDASTVRDLTSLVLVFPEDDGTYSVLPYFWVPGETARERERIDRVPWMAWQRDGHCYLSNGATIDKEHIKRTILDLHSQFNIKAIGYDPRGIMIEAQELYNAGVPMVEYQQLEINVSPAAKLFEKLILDGQIHHDGNPVMAWNVGNAGVETNKYGGIRPKKLRENGRIDGVMAATFSFGLIKNDQLQPLIDDSPKIYV